jgi:hypothetical protein
MLFSKKQTKQVNNEMIHHLLVPPPTPKEVAKIQTMLHQVETWIKAGENELAQKHWNLISDECIKHAQIKKGNSTPPQERPPHD